MEPIGASVISLRHVQEAYEEKRKSKNLITSSKSLSLYESDTFKCLLPQIIASLAVTVFQIGNGLSMAYSAILISQLEEPDSDFQSTKSQSAFMASVLILVAAPASIVSGILMDRIGRLNTIKLTIIPSVLGWATVALAPNMNIIILGRALIGISACLCTNPATVYIAEIANPKIRLSLMQLSPSCISFGMIMTYLGGWFINWRLLAWINILVIGLTMIGILFLHESPLWLIFKGKFKQARKSLDWFYKDQPKPPGKEETFAEIQFKVIQKQQEDQSSEDKSKGFQGTIKEFLKPTGYKPLILMTPLFFCQHYSGTYVTMFYSVTFIKEAGSDVNPFLASVLIGVIRFIMAIGNIFILKYVRRRTAIMTSCIGLALCMYISGQFTLWIKEGETTATWVPVVALLTFVVFSVIGMMFLPFMIISELFPLEIRGIGFTVAYSIATVFMFSALQSYYWMNDILGGPTNLQWFYGVVAMAGMVYSYIFLPETKGKKLIEITDNFKKGWLYIGKKHEEELSSTRVGFECQK